MAVSDVNMSSDGSGSSRLRQFGLYKNIDSRTAEFLKLSRKRQIRRGCACAAVSTAITVTVVVSALLVYEYGFHTESKMTPSTLRKFNWFNAVNDSDVTFNKNAGTHTNNTNNNKLLPIILKALDQKRYLETLIEEHSTTPSYDKTTDYLIEKNLFTDTRNWKGNIKLGEIGYKGPPQGFFKQRHAESFTKARKLIDYQRIMTYLNSLSSDMKVGESHQDHTSSTWKQFSSTGSYKTDFLYQDDYHKTESETKSPAPKEPVIVPGNNDIKSKESEQKSCQCPSKSNLADILKKLYNSIQQLRPSSFGKTPNNTEICNGRHSENHKSEIVQPPHFVNNQRVPFATRHLKKTTIPSKHRKVSFFRFSNKTITFKPETTTISSEIPASSTDKTNSLASLKQKTIAQNDYYIPHENRVNRFKAIAMPWILDIEKNATEATTIHAVYMHTEKTDNIAPSSKIGLKINRDIKENKTIATTKEIITTEKERTATEKVSAASEREKPSIPASSYINEDEETDFADEIDRFDPESNQYQHGYSARVDTEKHRVFEENNYLANSIDGLNQLYSKTFIINNPQTTLPTESPIVKPFELKRFFSYETIEPLLKLQKSTTELPRSIEPLQWFNEKQIMSTNKLLPCEPEEKSVINRKKGSLPMPNTSKPNFISKLQATTDKIKPSHGNVLMPMIQSYLLSRDGSGVLNLNSDTTTSVNKNLGKGSEELPFDFNMFSNEERDHIYANIINNVHTTTTVRPLDKGKSHLKKNIKHSLRTESTMVKEVKKKKVTKKRKLPKIRTWASSTLKYPKIFTNTPSKTEQKNHKVKEIFYMTGTEAPPDDFEANLHELMYFDRSPINYTALTNSFLNQTDSGSIEIKRSMLPEIRPSYLEIRRNPNHEEFDFDSHMYDEKNSIF